MEIWRILELNNNWTQGNTILIFIGYLKTLGQYIFRVYIVFRNGTVPIH